MCIKGNKPKLKKDSRPEEKAGIRAIQGGALLCGFFVIVAGNLWFDNVIGSAPEGRTQTVATLAGVSVWGVTVQCIGSCVLLLLLPFGVMQLPRLFAKLRGLKRD